MTELAAIIAGSSDYAASINAAIAAGETIVDNHGVDITLLSPIRPVSGMVMLLRPDTFIRKGWASSTNSVDCLIARADWAVDTDDFLVDGGNWCGSPENTGRIFSFYGNNWEIRNAQILEFHGGQAIVFGGDNVRLNNVRAITSATGYGTGAFRMIGGKGFRGTNLHGICGDDVFQFVPVTNSADARFSKPISDSFYIGCNGQSASARLLVAGIAGQQDEYMTTATIRRAGWIGCSGGGGNRSLVIECTEGPRTEGVADIPKQIDDILVSGCHIDGSMETGVTTQSAMVLTDAAGAIGKVTIRDSSIRGTPKTNGLSISGGTVILDNTEIEGTVGPVAITSPSQVCLIGGEMKAGTNHLIDIQSAAGATNVTARDTLFSGVLTGKAAIRASSATSSVLVDNITATKATGATGTMVVSHAAGSEIRTGRIMGDLDDEAAGAGSTMEQAWV